jgi:hypothetical protein
MYLGRSITQTVALVIDFTVSDSRATKRAHNPLDAMALIVNNLNRCHRLCVNRRFGDTVLDLRVEGKDHIDPIQRF